MSFPSPVHCTKTPTKHQDGNRAAGQNDYLDCLEGRDMIVADAVVDDVFCPSADFFCKPDNGDPASKLAKLRSCVTCKSIVEVFCSSSSPVWIVES
jgi:hypothetical protein